MFVINKAPTYQWKVSFESPDKGGMKKEEFVAEFNRYKQSELEAMVAELNEVAKDRPDDTDKVLELVNRVFVRWVSGIKTQDGEEFEYTEENRELLFEVPGMVGILWQAFMDSATSKRRKN